MTTSGRRWNLVPVLTLSALVAATAVVVQAYWQANITPGLLDGTSEMGTEADGSVLPADGTRERPYTMDKNVDDYYSMCPVTGASHDWHHTSGWYLRSRYSEFYDPHMLICRACGATMIG